MAVPPLARTAASAVTRLHLALALGPRHAHEHRRLVRERARRGAQRAGLVYDGLWQDAAAEVGAQAVRLGPGRFELSLAGRSTCVERWVTEIDDAQAVARSADRAGVQHALRAAGVPVPEHVELPAKDLRRALAFLAAGDRPCVVKPAGDTGAGYGITCGVRSRRDLVGASLEAARFASRLLVERQAPGAMYRVLVLDGEVIATVRRDPPAVTGDGRASIAELIAEENRRRLASGGLDGLSPVRVDLDCLLALRAAGLTLRTVLAAGRRVAVKTSSSDSGIDDNETIHEPLGPQLTTEVLAATRLSGLRLAGVDIVTPDPQRGLAEAGGALVEVNATPGLHHHLFVRDRATAAPVGAAILRRLLA
jgi:cyanophycin synthetase